jgi:hypothetical protein
MPSVRTLVRLDYEYLVRSDRDVLATTFATGGSLIDKDFQVAAGTILAFTIGAGVSDDLPALTFFYVRTDLDFSVEIVGSVIANNSNLGGKGPGVFYHRGAQTRVYNAAGGFAGALQNISKISVRNDGAAIANMRVVAC